MRLATIISLGASTALGVGALIVARLWMPSHTASAEAPRAPAPAPSVPVVVAAMPIPYGVKLEPKYLTVARLPRGAAPAGAYGSVGQILSQPGGPPTALVPMAAQEAVLPAKLTGVGERATLAALITPGKRAYTVGVNEISGAGGHVMPGDRVDVLLTREFGGQEGGGHRLATSVVLQNVRVLAMDQNANPTTTTPVVARSVTLEVAVQDAERLAVAAQAGTLSLALRKTGETEVTPAAGVRLADFGDAAPKAPAARPATRRAGPVKPVHQGPSVVIVNGDSVAKVQAPADGAAAGFL
jgi:pilus assembly protein CpaB